MMDHAFSKSPKPYFVEVLSWCMHFTVYLLRIFREILGHLGGGLCCVANYGSCILGEIKNIIALNIVL
jgi:hypothetical protein